MEQWQKGVIKNGNTSEKTWGEYGEEKIIKDV
jgi:hypothetical protein